MSSGKYLAHLGDVMLQEILVEGVSNLQMANKREGGNFLPAVGDPGELVLKKIDLELETVP